jgi:hypothetical protein
MTRDSTADLDVDGILEMCAKPAVPVNVRVGVAIAAHRIAFADFQARGKPVEGLAMHSLRAIVLARTPDVQDYRDQLDYLKALPLSAWESGRDYSAETERRETLAMIKRNMGHVERE